MLWRKDISGRAFLQVLSGEEDLKELGIEDKLTLRRLKELQEFRGEYKFRDSIICEGLVIAIACRTSRTSTSVKCNCLQECSKHSNLGFSRRMTGKAAMARGSKTPMNLGAA